MLSCSMATTSQPSTRWPTTSLRKSPPLRRVTSAMRSSDEMTIPNRLNILRWAPAVGSASTSGSSGSGGRRVAMNSGRATVSEKLSIGGRSVSASGASTTAAAGGVGAASASIAIGPASSVRQT